MVANPHLELTYAPPKGETQSYPRVSDELRARRRKSSRTRTASSSACSSSALGNFSSRP
ncbi:MAG: hypothetical protein U0235_21990 [Polyangiaceae bacterium]